ncbi:MAG TPA: protein kinase [Kofleriaceae bacterium]|nr:protein kinase [Kofleriaceae bacterium]
MPNRPSDSDGDLAEHGSPVEREGHETLLPSIARSVLSRPQVRLDPSGFQDVSETPDVEPQVEPRPDLRPDLRPDPRPTAARPGDVIGERYLVEGPLGRGGMGRVLRVRHAALGKVFALKLIKTTIATNPKIREMFYREARLASALSHDNICSIVDFGQDDEFGLFMVMELLEGQTAHRKLRQSGRVSPKVACDIAWQVADAVRFIHGRAIVHGDIKSENIFLVKTVTQRRLVKLLDFGLARPDVGRIGGVDGTPEYLAPERQDGVGASQASDIYALGIVLYELLCGEVPFRGPASEVLLHHKLTAVPAPSRQIPEPLDERADALIARATAKEPAARHPDVPSFMYELRALMGMLGMDQSSRRRAFHEARERRELDHRVKAAAEVFGAVPLPMASCDASGRVRAANPAFLEFLGAAGDAAGLELRDSALPEVYPTLFEDLEEVAARRQTIKRVVYLHEGGDRVIEAAVLLSAAPAGAEVTAGEVHLVLHPLRALSS